MEVCGEAENRLASELMQHELQIEKDVLDPLSQLAEVRGLAIVCSLLFAVATRSPKFAEVPGNTARLPVISGTRRGCFLCSRMFYCSSQVSHYEFGDMMCERQY